MGVRWLRFAAWQILPLFLLMLCPLSRKPALTLVTLILGLATSPCGPLALQGGQRGASRVRSASPGMATPARLSHARSSYPPRSTIQRTPGAQECVPIADRSRRADDPPLWVSHAERIQAGQTGVRARNRTSNCASATGRRDTARGEGKELSPRAEQKRQATGQFRLPGSILSRSLPTGPRPGSGWSPW